LAPPSKEKGELSSDQRRGEEDSTHNLNAATNEKKVIWTKAPHLHLVGRNLEVLSEVLIDPRRETSVPPHGHQRMLEPIFRGVNGRRTCHLHFEAQAVTHVP
jgi:hypothetical protein